MFVGRVTRVDRCTHTVSPHLSRPQGHLLRPTELIDRTLVHHSCQDEEGTPHDRPDTDRDAARPDRGWPGEELPPGHDRDQHGGDQEPPDHEDGDVGGDLRGNHQFAHGKHK